MIILPQQQSIGEILGQGLADVAGHWAQHRTTSKALKDLGFSDAQAKAYANLSPQIQQQAVHARQQQQQQEAVAANLNKLGLGSLPGGNSPQFQPSSQPYNMPKPQMSGMQPQPQEAAIQQATSIAQNPSFRKLQEQQQQAQALQNQQQLTGQANPQRQAPITGEQQAILQSQAQQAARKPAYEDKLAHINKQRQALGVMQLNPNDRFKAEALLNSAEDRAWKEEQHRQKQEDKKEERKEKREDTLRKDLDSISKRAERAHQDIHLLKQIKAANDTGTLIQGPKRRLIEDLGKKYGFNFQDYFTNPTTENAAKLIERMQTGAGSAFGTGRLTNFIAEAYGKSLPRLANSQEGMDVIIKNLILEDEGHIALNDEIRKIKSEYRAADKILPTDIEDMARERVQPKLDKLAEQALGNIDTAVKRQEGFESGKIKKFNETPNANKFPDGTVGTNKKTGQKLIVKDGKWVPYKG